jgi:GNAT superfamily N-acetyltransferase
VALFRVVTLCVYEQPVRGPVAPPPLPAGTEFDVLEGPRATLDPAVAWHPDAEPRLRDGQACALVRQGAEVIAYCWLAATPIWVGEIGRAVVPGPDDVYFYDAFTAPAWRGRRLFPSVLARLLSLAHGRGRRHALIFVGSRNRSSRRAIERAQFTLTHTVTRIDVLGVTSLWFRGPRPPGSRVSLVRIAAPR